jgi:hypothetical protein
MFSTHRIIFGTIKKIKGDFAEVSSGETDEHQDISTSTAPRKLNHTANRAKISTGPNSS